MTTRITVILPAYNAAATIAHAIDSVQAQSVADWVLLVIDDGSTDGTSDIVRARAKADPRVKLIDQANAGVAAARNAGVAATETELIAFLDADDALAPSYLERMIDAHEADPDLALVCCDAWTFREKSIPIQQCSENYGMVPPITLERVLSREFQIYAAASLKTSWYRKVGGTDESFRNSVDLDLWVRVLLAGGPAAYIDEPLAWYRIDQPGSLSGAASRIQLKENEIRILEKVKVKRPDLGQLSDEHIQRLKGRIALLSAKTALQEKRYSDFFQHSRDVQRLAPNPRLRGAVAVAKISPALAHRLFARS